MFLREWCGLCREERMVGNKEEEEETGKRVRTRAKIYAFYFTQYNKFSDTFF